MTLNKEKSSRVNVRTLLFSVLVPVYLEILLHLFAYSSLSPRIVFPVLFGAAAGALLYAVSSLFGQKAGAVIHVVLLGLVTFYFEVQFVYQSIFGEFMSLWQITFGATAIANFWRPMLYGIVKVLPQIVLLLIPVPLAIIAYKKRFLRLESFRFLRFVIAIALVVAFHLSALGVMHINDTDAYSVFKLYQSANTATEVSLKNVGLIATTRLEAKNILLSVGDGQTESSEYGDTVPARFDAAECNVLPIDFAALRNGTNDEKLKALDGYFLSRYPTEKNEYTGMLKDYNLIMLCCESFSPYFIDEERTPALYQLSHNGFIFENYYGSFPSNTTNGEYTLCTGLFPDTSRAKSSASFYASQNHHLPFCLGNLFTAKGVQAWAYHNYTGAYYTRSVTHANMGFTFKAADSGLDMRLSYPASDLEMMQKSVDDYIDSGKQFCTYYMTFSGHYQYDWDNPMSAKNRAAVEALDYSETVKAYISCNLELEYALEYLLDRLEQAGIADKTAIVLTNDHYPYGLNASQYNELAGKEVDTVFGKYKNSFIFYVPGIRVPVSTYCSTVDILPTILNLFGLDYDSRLLAGKDVLSPQAENMAILADHSYITPDYGFDATTGTLYEFSDYHPSVEELAAADKLVSLKFQSSTDILNSDYYAHVFLGAEVSGETYHTYQFTDIPQTFIITGLEYVIENGYMMPESETLFGFSTPATVSEYLRVLYQIDTGRTDGKAISPQEVSEWAIASGVLTEKEASEINGETLLTRKTAGLYVYRFAQKRGNVSNFRSEEEPVPGFTQEEIDAFDWCFEASIMTASGTRISNFEQADSVFTRMHIIYVVYKYYLHFQQNV